MSAGLQGTLTPGGTMTPDEATLLAARQQLLQAAAASQTLGDTNDQQAQAANQATTQAGQQYSQLASQPQPDLAPMEAFVPTLMSHIASIISGNKGYDAQNQESLDSAKKDLLITRMQTLNALKDNYDKQAAAAEKMGDVAMQGKILAQKDRLDQARVQVHDLLVQQQLKDYHTADINAENARAAARNATDLKIAQIRANLLSGGTAGGLKLDDFVEHTSTGDPYINTAKIDDKLLKNQVEAAARTAKIPYLADPKRLAALSLLDVADANIQNIFDQVKPILPTQGGIPGIMTGLENKAMGTLMLGERGKIAGAFNSFRTAAIEMQQALGSLGQGQRMNMALINAVMNYDIPQVGNTVAIAQRKVDNFHSMINLTRSAALGKPLDAKELHRLMTENPDRMTRLNSAAPNTPATPETPAPTANPDWTPSRGQAVPVNAHTSSPRGG
jgi:hypothetical protein